MRKGRGELTYKQLLNENRRLKKENEKLRNDLNSRTVALNKALEEGKDHDNPEQLEAHNE